MKGQKSRFLVFFSGSDSDSDIFSPRSPDKTIKDIGLVDDSFDFYERGVGFRTNLKSLTRRTWAWQATPFFKFLIFVF